MGKCIIDLTASEAREFLMKGKSYCSIDLPPYFNFDKFIKDAANIKDNIDKPYKYSDVCYTLMSNKDGRFAWRPLTLINPILYNRLVELITESANWDEIKNFFGGAPNLHIQCCSLPIVPDESDKHTNKAITITNWWSEVEQKSIELNLQYKYVLVTDITNCYGSLYTHSISWALNGKAKAKEKLKTGKSDTLGDNIDRTIRDMQYGQTNGIPQGSVLMDFIAEIVLHYVDNELENKIEGAGVVDYKILRYRDDYRVFCNNNNDLEHITKLLSETLAECGFSLNAGKTFASSEIIRSVIKPDKLYYISNTPILVRNCKSLFSNIQEELLFIYDFASKFPNSGMLVKLLTRLYEKRIRAKIINSNNVSVLISIVTEIMCNNPKVYSIGTAIISSLMLYVPSRQIDYLIKSIHKKCLTLPNTGIIQLWLQRMCISLHVGEYYTERLCQRVGGSTTNCDIWNVEWISANHKRKFNEMNFIDSDIVSTLTPIYDLSEINPFSYPL